MVKVKVSNIVKPILGLVINYIPSRAVYVIGIV